MKFRIAFAAALAGGMWAGVAQAQDSIKIGITGPFTGGSSSMGVSMRDGVKLAAEEINKAGGVEVGAKKLKIELIERDDEARNEMGVQIAQEFINKEKVVAAVGYINSGVSLASHRFFQESEIPVINNVSTASVIAKQFLPPEHKANYIFRTSANDTIQSGMIVDEAITRQGFKKPAILADSTNYGQLGVADLTAALAKKDIKPVATEKFNIKDTDMTAQILRAKEAGADVILTYAIGPELAQIANGMAKLGWKVPLIGSWTLSMSSFIDTAGPNGEGAIMPQTFIQQATTPKRKVFIESYQAAYKVDRMASPVSAAQGYDSVFLLAAAIKQAGSLEGRKIREALENLNDKIDGVVTVYDHPFNKDDHEAITANIPVMGIVKGGRVVPAHPEDIAGDKAVRVKTKS